MSGGQRSKNYRQPILGTACGVILLAGLAAGGHWHRAAKAAGTSMVHTTLTSGARAVQSSFAPPPRLNRSRICRSSRLLPNRPSRLRGPRPPPRRRYRQNPAPAP